MIQKFGNTCGNSLNLHFMIILSLKLCLTLTSTFEAYNNLYGIFLLDHRFEILTILMIRFCDESAAKMRITLV